MRKRKFNLILSFAVSLLAFLFGSPHVMMAADAANLPDAGTTSGGDASQTGTGNNGVLTTGETQNIMGATGNDAYVMNDVDQQIVKIRPMNTPVDNISRYSAASPTTSWACKYYSVGTKPIKTTLTADVAEQTSGLTISLSVADPQIFTKDDTIRVVGVKAITNAEGSAYNDKDPKTPDLELVVIGTDPGTNNPTVCAINGKKNGDGKAILLPAIPNGTTIIRMGKSCGELAVQTGRFFNLPEPDIQYCQNFMIQVEQGTLDKIQKKEVGWGFSDLEEDAIYDIKLTKELTGLFGDRAAYDFGLDKNGKQWFTKGIYWMAGKDIQLGHLENGKAVISDDDLVDFSKDAFTGVGNGNKRKILFCGSDVLANLSKLQSEKFRLKEVVSKWDLQFKSWQTDFGEVLTIHHELFDLCGMSDQAFLLDPAYLKKRTFLAFTQSALDLKKAGIRNTDANVMQEISCLYLRYPKSHARVKLAA